MKAYQFWILILCSSFVAILMIKQIFLTRQLNQEQHRLAEYQQVAAQGANFENAWKQLASRIYQVSEHDPEMAEILKKEEVQVHPKSMENPYPGGATPFSMPAPSPSPVPPLHPADE